jgi:hypothetical protein
MVNHKTRALIAVAAFLAAASPAAAQRWGRERVPQSGACFYEDENYRGDYFCVPAGENVGAVPDGMNDRISSIRLFGRVEVVVFRDIRFGGYSTRFADNVRNLQDEGWNDRISSLRVRGDFDSFNRPGGGRNFGDVDRIIRRAYEDILGREPDAEGLRNYRSHMLDDGWSEARVRQELQGSDEYRDRGDRGRMTRPRAEEIVRRAYLNVLRREPDPGSRGYVDRVLRDRATQQDIERDLRNSDEYRNRNR